MSNLPFSTQTLETFTAIASLAWWIYIVIVILIFFGGLLLNYIVKKINEARLETRFENLSIKAGANQATQIQRPIAEQDRPILPTNGISLVFNKEDNLLEDKRRKDEPHAISPISEVQVNVTITSTDNMEQKSDSGREDEITESVFLGSIYKELFENRLGVDRSKSLLSAITRRDSIMSDIFNQMVWKKITESKSTPSVKKFCSMKSEEYLRGWIFDLVSNKVPDVPKPVLGDIPKHMLENILTVQVASPTNQLIYSEPADLTKKNLPTSSVQECSDELPRTSSVCK